MTYYLTLEDIDCAPDDYLGYIRWQMARYYHRLFDNIFINRSVTVPTNTAGIA
jgi:hypothetical protein